MYETILWATDGSSGAEDALPDALRLASIGGGRVVAVHCDQQSNGRSSESALESDVIRFIQRRVDDLKDQGVDIELVVRRSHQDAAETVAAVARELNASVIVCGTRGRSPAASALLGSFTLRLLHSSPCPVLAVSPTAVAQRAAHATAGGGA